MSIQTPEYIGLVSNYLMIGQEVEMIGGHMHPGQEHILFDLARMTPPDCNILEVGSFKGRSTAALAFACLGTDRHVYTIDTFTGLPDNTNDNSGEFFLGEFLKNIDDRGLTDYVTPLVGPSSDYWQEWNKPLGMLFIDGNHEDEIVRSDASYFSPHVIPGGIVAMHDVYDLNPPNIDDMSGPSRAWYETLPMLSDVRIYHNLVWGRKKAEGD